MYRSGSFVALMCVTYFLGGLMALMWVTPLAVVALLVDVTRGSSGWLHRSRIWMAIGLPVVMNLAGYCYAQSIPLCSRRCSLCLCDLSRAFIPFSTACLTASGWAAIAARFAWDRYHPRWARRDSDDIERRQFDPEDDSACSECGYVGPVDRFQVHCHGCGLVSS